MLETLAPYAIAVVILYMFYGKKFLRTIQARVLSGGETIAAQDAEKHIQLAYKNKDVVLKANRNKVLTAMDVLKDNKDLVNHLELIMLLVDANKRHNLGLQAQLTAIVQKFGEQAVAGSSEGVV